MRVDIGPFTFKRHLNRRQISVKIHAYDCWAADQTLAFILVPMLKRIKAEQNGIPSAMFEDERHEPTDEHFEVAVKKWDEILDKMIWSMTEIATNKKNYPKRNRVKGISRKREAELLWKRLESAEPDSEYEEKKWQEFEEKEKIYEDRLQEGCELLGKYFRFLCT